MNIFKIFYYLFIKRFLYFSRQRIYNHKKVNKKDYKEIKKNLIKNGYCVIENFISPGECNYIKNKIIRFIKKNPKHTIVDNEKSDSRIHGAEFICSKIRDYFSSNYLKSIGEEYSNNKLKNLMTMANKTIFRKKNKGSGNGWHRDSINIQYKSILYLNDVNADNGAFQIIENSKSKNEILKFLILNNLDPSKTSFSENLIKKNLKDKKLKLKTLIGKKGTLILVDTSCIHRGSPLKTGIRYAITNYYYPKNLINKYDKQFSKRIKKII